MSFDASQINFNPSWMQPASLKGDRLNGVSFSMEDDSVQDLIDPIFANHRYGREDLLALIVKDMKAPEGLSQCPFFVDKPQIPIILQPLNETEIRLQQNINSSKALSALSRQDRQLINGGESLGTSNSKWNATGNENRNFNNFPSKFIPNRWSGLNNSSGSGNENNNFRGTSRTNSSSFNRSATAGLRLSSSEQSRSNLSSRYRISSTTASQSNEVFNSISETQSPSTSSTTGPRSWNKVGFPKSSEASKDVKLNENTRLIMNEVEKETTGNYHEVIKKDEVKKEITKNKDDILVSTAPNLNGTNTFSQAKLVKGDNENWFYLDPNDVQRGPYESCQMQTWFDNGYFDSNLRIRRVKDKEFFTLGELFHINGAMTPFISKNNDMSLNKVEKLNESYENSTDYNISLMQSSKHNEPSTETCVWSNLDNINNPTYSSTQDIKIEKALLEKERLIEEEQKKLKEKEDFLRKEEQERLEKERLIREKELELLKKQEEIQRIAREKEEELERKRHEVAEFEQQRLEVVVKMEEKLRNEHMLRVRQKQETRLRFEAEAMKFVEAYRLIIQAEEKRKLEEQKLLEERRKRKEEEANICAAYEEAQRLQEQAALILAEKEKKLRQEDKERLEREKLNAETKLKRHTDCEKNVKKTEEINQDEVFRLRQMEEELSQAAIQAILNESPPPMKNKSSPWVTVGCNKHNKKEKILTKQVENRGKTLVEIQFEEEEALRLKLKQQQELFEKHQKNQTSEASSVAWTKPTSGSKWNTNLVTSLNHSTTKETKTNSWNTIAPPPAVPIPKNLEKNNAKKNAKKQTKVALKSNNVKTKKSDAFTKWIINRVKELNSLVDAEVFASFIEEVESPNDVEDYIMGYLGETKMTKDFYREFLNKRIELCPRVLTTEKDDLSRPAVAANDVTLANTNNINLNSGQKNSTGGKKKKKGKSQKILDPKVLGFKVSGDPNRFNAGEIDTDIPVSTNRKR